MTETKSEPRASARGSCLFFDIRDIVNIKTTRSIALHRLASSRTFANRKKPWAEAHGSELLL